MYKDLQFFSLLILSIGCADPDPNSVVIASRDLSDPELDIAIASIRRWEALGWQIHDGRDLAVPDGIVMEIRVGDLAGPAGESYVDAFRFTIDDGVDVFDPRSEPVFAHEAGHLLLDADCAEDPTTCHLPPEQGIMSGPHHGTVLTEADYAFACARTGKGCF